MLLNFNPIGKEEIHKLEIFLLLATLLREEVIEEIRNSSERLTWVDSLAVAAGAVARKQAGMSIPEIAEELGRTEQTIREHLKGDSKAGKMVLETLEKLKKEEIDLEKLIASKLLGEIKSKLLEVKSQIEDIIKMI